MLNSLHRIRYASMILAVSICLHEVVSSVQAVDFDPFAGQTTTSTSAKSLNTDKGPTIPQVQFINNDMAMAFQIISDATGWSIFPTAGASKEKISLWAKDISALDLLDTVVSMSGLIYHRDGNIITVMTYDEYMEHHGLDRKVITPRYAEAEALSAVIKPFFTKLGKCVVHKETNSLVLYDSEANLRLTTKIIESLDCPSNDSVIEIVDLQYADSEMLATTLKDVFSPKQTKENAASTRHTQSSATGAPKNPTAGTPEHSRMLDTFHRPIEFFPIGRTNQLVVKCRKSDIRHIKDVVTRLDTYMESTTKSYHFLYVDAAEVYKGLEQVLNISDRKYTQSAAKSGGVSKGLSLLEKSNSIVLTAPPSAHRIMTSIKESVDAPAPFEASVIRIYKLENADVTEVADVIRQLIEGAGKQDPAMAQAQFSSLNMDRAIIKPPEPAPGILPAAPAMPPRLQDVGTTGEILNKLDAKVSVSKSTNSIVVQATAREQRELERIIQELDKRRRQVLIKAMIVEVTTTDSLKLGVELGNANGHHIEFSSFGLSTIDPKTGERTIVVSPGGTAAYFDTQDLTAIIQALKSDGNVKVSSEPQILVNDNSVGTIQSVAEEPITQVNASQTVATTSFAGFVEAGTQFKITPHISQKDYLRVEYEIILNTFGTRSPDPSIPPPRSTSSIKSEATVPDTHTIVVGGLQTVEEGESFDKVPIVGDIPLIGLAFRKQTTIKRYKTSYLFITPCIMKDPSFKDLKCASEQAQTHMADVEEKSTPPCHKIEKKILRMK